jgi:REP element-mobilizing transposase RayT
MMLFFITLSNTKTMSHSLTRVWIHAVWTTKDRQPLINLNIEKEVHAFMARQFQNTGCHVKIINGMPDHVHCLFQLNPGEPLANIVKQVKGSTSHWINHGNLTESRFSWQTGYAVFSIGEPVLTKVYNYILNQKKHHQFKSVQEEWLAFQKDLNLN